MIRNVTRKAVLSRNEKICKTAFSKFKGLMFSRKIKNPLVFVNPKEIPISIHMFFVFFPIDVAWLDEKKRAVHIQTLRPFSVSKAINAKYIIEFAHGSLGKTKLGDILEFHA